MTEREEAIRFVVSCLGSSLAMMSNPTRLDALRLAREHKITAEELLLFVTEKARRA